MTFIAAATRYASDAMTNAFSGDGAATAAYRPEFRCCTGVMKALWDSLMNIVVVHGVLLL